MLEDEVFAGYRKSAKGFIDTFSEILAKAVTGKTETSVKGLQTFHDKYEQIEASLEAWSFDEVAWMYLSDTEAEVKRDFSSFRAARKEASELLTKIASIMKLEGVQGEKLVTVATVIQESKETLEGKLRRSGLIAIQVLFNEIIFCENGSQTIRDDLEKFTQAKYGLGMANLPEKLQQKLRDLPPTGPDDTFATKKKDTVAGEGGNAPEVPKVPKEEKKEKEKGDKDKKDKHSKEKKEKKEKDKDKDKDKEKKRNKSIDAPPPKEIPVKKSRKSK